MHNNYEVNNKMRMKINITSNLIDKLKSYKTLTSSANSTRNQSIIKFDSLQKSFLASTKHKRKEVHKKANQYKNIISKNLSIYNATSEQYNKYVIHSIIFDEKRHIVSEFKNYLLWDETSEFLRRYYKIEESTSRIPKISSYYEKYTMFPPVYFGLDDENNYTMRKFVKRKKKYLEFLEDNEDAPVENNKKKNEHFELMIRPEAIEVTKNESKTTTKNEPTVELTTYNDKLGKEKSICSLLNELSTTNTKVENDDTSTNKKSKFENLKFIQLNKDNLHFLSLHKIIPEKNSIVSKSKVLTQPKGVTKLNLKNITNKNHINQYSNTLNKNNESTHQTVNLKQQRAYQTDSRNAKTVTKISHFTKRLVLKQLQTNSNYDMIPKNVSRNTSRRNSKTLSIVSSNKMSINKTSKRKYILGRNVHLSVNKNSDNLYPYLNREYSEGNQYMMGCYTESNQKILTERNMYKYPLTSRKKISTEEDIIKKILMRKRVIKK